MVKNYLKIALRGISRSKGLSIIAISGLVLGIASCTMIMQYVIFEMSYDQLQPAAEDIYRVSNSIQDNSKETVSYATTYLPIAPTLKEEFPEVIDYNRILYLDRHAVVTYQDKIFQQEGVIYSDPSFFSFFAYPLVHGDPKRVLAETNTVVISESLVKKYFGDKNPIGQFIKLNEEFNELNLLVTGVHMDIPENTHLKPKMVVSLKSVETLPAAVDNTWTWPIYLNYIRLEKNADVLSLERKLPKFAVQYIPQNIQQSKLSFFLQPLSSIHLYSHLQYEIEENGSATMVYLLLVVAILILVIAYVNYINLTTAKSLSRAKEVGIRKVMGSKTSQLVRQFMMEAGLFNIVAILLAILVVLTVQNTFLKFTGIKFDFSIISTPRFLLSIMGCILAGTFLSALYPATVMASYTPMDALKGQSAKTAGGLFTRKALVIFQFAATIGLMINAYAIFLQVDHMRSQTLGIDINPILIVNAPRVDEQVMRTSNNHEDPFKAKVLGMPGIQNVSVSASIPGVWISKSRGIYQSGQEQEKNLTYYTLGVDYDFLSTYSLDLLAGRNFSEDFGTDDNAVVLTEKAMRQLGFSTPEKALNEKIMMGKDEREIIGVARDYHHLSLRENYQATIFYPEWKQKEFYSLKLENASTQNIAGILASLENQWKEVYPSNPFEYSFLNTSFHKQYNADVTFGKVFSVFTILAILLACLGLFGLASFITTKRTKEIGIRKVLGSTTREIIILLLSDMTILILWAGMIAIPIAYVSSASWLSQFAFRIALTWWIFLIPLLSTTIIALTFISFQIIRTATVNPVKSLKYE